MEQVVYQMLKETEELGAGDYKKAFENYLFCMENAQHLRPIIEKLIEDRLTISSSLFDQNSETDALFSIFELTLRHFPENDRIIFDLAQYLYKYGFLEEAKNHFEVCLKLNKHNILANKLLLSINCRQIERWHYKMLNDRNRNENFKKALEFGIKQLSKPITLLDVGTGTGIFSLMASQMGVDTIVACDQSLVMTEIATKVLKSNLDESQRKKITILNSELSMVAKNYQNSFNIIILELFDAGVFGEHVIEVLCDAYSLLSPQNHLIIPYRVQGFLVGISSDQISRKFRLRNEIKEKIEIFQNFRLKTKKTENYDTYTCNRIKFDFITNTIEAFCVNFNNFEDLKRFKNFQRTLNFQCTKPDVVVDAFMLFFKLHLAENSNLVLSTNPIYQTCWDQAIFFNESSLLESPTSEIQVQIEYKNEQLSLNSFNIGIDNLFELDELAILMLNDLEFVDTVLNNDFCKTDLNIFDAMPFPLFGIVMVLKHKCRLTYLERNDNTEQLLRVMCRNNGIDFDKKIEIIAEDDIERFCVDNCGKFHLVFINYFEKIGILNEDTFVAMNNLRLLLSDDPDSGFLPKLCDVRIFIEIISCPWLRHVTEVNDDNVCGLKIAESINKFKIDEHYDFKIDSLQFETFTGPTKLKSRLSNNNNDQTENIELIRHTSRANAIIYWFEYQLFGQIISTRSKYSYVNNAAVIFDQDIQLTLPSIPLKIVLNSGHLKFFLGDY